MQVNKVAVVGSGTMGSSIAVALISRGYPTILKDVDDKTVQGGLSNIDRLLKSRVDKGMSPKEAEAQRALILPTTDYATFADVDFVIEAVPESIELKRKVFEDLDEWCNVDAIFGSNTSSLSITQIGAFTRRPDKVVGLHFFNPAHLMKLVEVIPGLETSHDTVNSAIELGISLGKLAVRVEECASFLVNRLLGRYINESLWCLQEGVAPVEEIDKAACDYVMPIGPLALRDMNGSDVGLAVARFNFQEYGDRFLPAPILEEMVKLNLLGQKTREGFYKYDENTRKRTGANSRLAEILVKVGGIRESGPPFNAERLFLPMINEAFLVLQEKVCDIQDLDPAMMAGLGMRRGPLALASEIGLAECLRKIEALNQVYGERFRPAPLLKRYVWANRTSVL
ncbi:MAG: 3-hydroxyacyl-CoA dehydrogenase [Cyanobacteria bacterium SZAS-4]|nr:3-hydroxyacyl-CoA dehydrogenase [Cyanobacteria bacterium SZAS-4]